MTDTRSIPVSMLIEQLKDVDAKILRLTVMRELLAGLLERLPASEPRPEMPQLNGDGGTGRPRPREAVAQLLAREPGLTVTQIADRLASEIRSNAQDVKNVLRTTAARLVTEKRLTRDEHGRHFLVKEGP